MFSNAKLRISVTASSANLTANLQGIILETACILQTDLCILFWVGSV